MAPKSRIASSSTAATPSIQWPLFPSFTNPLSFNQELYPGIITISQIFPPSLLSTWLNFLNSNQSPIQFNSSPPSKKGEATRTNHRFSIKDSNFANSLWELTGMKELCQGELKSNRKGKKAIGLNDNIRIYRYSEEEYFGPHYDDDMIDPLTGYRSEYTLLIYLTGEEDGVVGGETAFYPDGISARKGKTVKSIIAPLERGSALLHRHGRDCIIHEGQVVKKGIKFVLRSDVMFG